MAEAALTCRGEMLRIKKLKKLFYCLRKCLSAVDHEGNKKWKLV